MSGPVQSFMEPMGIVCAATLGSINWNEPTGLSSTKLTPDKSCFKSGIPVLTCLASMEPQPTVTFPANVLAMPKIRDGKLEWLQIIRSNDMFLGVPHNFVQFTCLQEILAGWLGVECGTYNQISDSLHVYDRHWEKVVNSSPFPCAALNRDYLTLSRAESDRVFKELEHRVEQMIHPETEPDALEGLSTWDTAPEGYRNIGTVLVAEALRRRGLVKTAARTMSHCTNPAYQQLWSRWCSSRQMNSGRRS